MVHDGFCGTLISICNQLSELYNNIEKINSINIDNLNEWECMRLEYTKCRLMVVLYQVYLGVNGMGSINLDKHLNKINRYAETISDSTRRETKTRRLDLAAIRMLNFHR